MNAVAERGLERIVKSGEAIDALFKSTHGALKFALNHTQSTLTKSTLAGLLPVGRPGRGLSGLDGAAQAGMIRAELGRLDDTAQAFLIAKIAVPTLDCACRSQCCRGYRAAPEWSAAVAYLAEYALSEGLTGTISYLRLRRALVARYFGARENLVDVGKACGVHRNTVSSYNKALKERFEVEERRAMMVMSERLWCAGLVE